MKHIKSKLARKRDRQAAKQAARLKRMAPRFADGNHKHVGPLTEENFMSRVSAEDFANFDKWIESVNRKASLTEHFECSNEIYKILLKDAENRGGYNDR